MKRKKKLRVARVEKDEEELIFDAECLVFRKKCDNAHRALLNAEHELNWEVGVLLRQEGLRRTFEGNIQK